MGSGSGRVYGEKFELVAEKESDKAVSYVSQAMVEYGRLLCMPLVFHETMAGQDCDPPLPPSTFPA